MLLSGFGAIGFGRFYGLCRGEFCRSNLADPDRLSELFEIFSTLVGIGKTEAGDCLVESQPSLFYRNEHIAILKRGRRWQSVGLRDKSCHFSCGRLAQNSVVSRMARAVWLHQLRE
jgi:hypothetical protein